MEDLKLDRLHPGLPVSDVRGEKIGTLAGVYGRAPADPSASSGSSGGTPTAAAERIVEVKTGFLGLGKHLYVPTRAIETVTDDHVILDCPREEADAHGWTERPAGLTKLA